MCIEVTRDQSVVGEGEEVGEVRGVVRLAGAGGRDVNIDDSQFRSVDLYHNGLVLEVRVVWEKVVQVSFSVGEGVVDQCDESTSSPRSSVFPDCGEVFEWLEVVGWGESRFLDDGNQNFVFLQEILYLLE